MVGLMDVEVVDTEEFDRKEEEAIAKMFFKQLDDARELISVEGGDVGLCPHCQDTGYIFMEKDGYTGKQARIENEVRLFNECYHGAPLEDGSFTF